MYSILNEGLALLSSEEATVEGFSKEFMIEGADNIADLSLIIITATGEGLDLTAYLQESNDGQTWVDIQTLPFDFVAPREVSGITVVLSARRYRVRWEFTSDPGPGVCVVAGNVHTAHL